MFYEIVVAPGYTPEGLEVLKGKSKALRILEAKPRPPSGRSLRQVAGGWLLQVWGISAVYVLLCAVVVSMFWRPSRAHQAAGHYAKWLGAGCCRCGWFGVRDNNNQSL
jgi:AICAR transformylase/IMP cyclohydrolase PurH